MCTNLIFGGISGGLVCGTTALLTEIHPAAGFAAGFTYSYLGGNVFELVNDTAQAVKKLAYCIFSSAAVAKLTCLALGVPLSFKAAVLLSLIAPLACPVIFISLYVGIVSCDVFLFRNGYYLPDMPQN